MEARISPMLVEHISSVVELEQCCQLSSRGAKGYAKLLEDPFSVLLVSLDKDSKVIGCFSGWLVADELEIDNVAVAPDWRRFGIGANLITSALHAASQKGAVQAFLEVRSSNSAACSLYEKIGFMVSGRRKDYYRDPVDDALILSCKIADLR